MTPLTVALAFVPSLLAQTGPDRIPAEPEARLEVMNKAVSSYVLRSGADPETEYRFLPEPVLRFTNPVGTAVDGAIFLWTDEVGRPVTALQVFAHRDGHWYHEFTSLTAASLTVGRVWGPTRAGVEFKPLPGAPKPANTAAARLHQIRTLAGEFTAEDEPEQQSWQRLRMLTKPFARYGKPGTEVIDGVLLAFVLTTDPEVYLMLEARQGTDGPEWQYAFMPASIYAVRASWKGHKVWALPFREAWTDSLAPYFVRRRVPVPSE